MSHPLTPITFLEFIKLRRKDILENLEIDPSLPWKWKARGHRPCISNARAIEALATRLGYDLPLSSILRGGK